MKKTGRIFKCIGLKSVNAYFWNKYFNIGILYYEVQENIDIIIGGNEINNLIYLASENGISFWYVDKDQFELIEDE
jgi:hypothetical protein